jgi:hypothetical protein
VRFVRVRAESRKEVSKVIPLLRILVLGGFAAALAFLFFPFVIPGMLLSRIVKSPHERWVLPSTALLIVVGWRIIFGTWAVSIGGDSDDEWMVEGLELVVSWAYGVIFVRAGFWIPHSFREVAALQPTARC